MLKKIFLKDTKSWWYWIVIAVFIKVLFAVLIFSQRIPDGEKDTFFFCAGDTDSYLMPIDNFIEKGEYSPDFRMPGYGAAYFMFRQLFSQKASQNMMIVSQLFLDGVSVYVLALLTMQLFNSRGLFYAVFFTYALSTYTSVFDIYLLTDSFSVSALIFSAFYFIKGLKKTNHWPFLVSGALLTWCVFLKPVSLPLFGLFIIILALYYIRFSRDSRPKLSLAKALLLFLMLFALLDGLWIARNYRAYNKLIPLQRKLEYPRLESDAVYMGLRNFLETWGGDCTYWNPKAEICWFGYTGPSIAKQVRQIKFPGYIYTSKFNYDDLVKVKNYITLSGSPEVSESERARLRGLAAARINEYADSIKKEKPRVYYIYAPIRFLKTFLFHSGTYNLFNKPASELNIFELGIKLLMSALYVFAVIFGFLGAIVLFYKNGLFGVRSLLAVAAVYLTLVFPFVFRKCEYRYFTQAYPFMIACALYLAAFIYGFVAGKYMRKGS